MEDETDNTGERGFSDRLLKRIPEPVNIPRDTNPGFHLIALP